MIRAVGYLRVSTAEQSESGAGLSAQRSLISAEAERRGWDLTVIEDRAASGRDLRRDGLQEALQGLAEGTHQALVVAKLDRLSRSVQDFSQLMTLARKQGWAIVALDLGVDTTTPAGELIANVMASVAQWERRIIGQRTKDALAERKAAGVRLGGSKPLVAPETVAMIVRLSESLHPNAIARALATAGVPAPAGGARWHGSTVSRILRANGAAAAA